MVGFTKDNLLTDTNTRIAQIEGLRGIAIIIIVIYHIFDRYQQIYRNTSIRWMDFWGTFGTSIFLILSGYFLVKPGSQRLNAMEGVRIFWKKIVRLWPCYAVCITITFVCTQIYELPERTVNAVDYLLNLLLVNRFLGAPYVDGAHWYLGVLISATFVVLFLRCLGLHCKPLAYAVWMLIEVIIDGTGLLYVGETYLFCGPFIGCICTGTAIHFLKDSKNSGKNRNLSWVCLCACSVVYTLAKRGIVSALELVIIIPVVLFCTQRKHKLLECKPLLFLGMVSYPVYLIHQNIGFLLEWKLIDWWGKYSYWIPMVTCGIVFMFGVGLYYIVEKPIQKKLRTKG